MENQTAAALIENLMQRNPSLTDIEKKSLEIAIGCLREEGDVVAPALSTQHQPAFVLNVAQTKPIDVSCLDLASADESVTLCIDFGTAMSKAAIVDTSSGDEVPQLLDLGIPTDQEHISASMLVSSAYVSQEGFIYFGQEAVDRSQEEALSVDGHRIDNMKRFLSEGDADDTVDSAFNPTDCDLTGRHVLLGYLAYLTWACSECLAKLGYPRNILRKYAVPCLTGQRRHQVNNLMLDLLGWAQFLADSVGSRLQEGMPLAELLDWMYACEKIERTCDFVVSDVAEPIAVAASYPGREAEFASVFLAIDVGAGTTDFGLFKVAVSSSREYFSGACPGSSLRVVREAGDYLDRALRAYVLKSTGIDAKHPLYKRLHSHLVRDIRDLKESLFIEGRVFPTLPDGVPELEIKLEDFLETPAVQSFTNSIEETVQSILEEVDFSWLTANEYIGVLLTGGGAGLPMLQGLTDRTIEAQGKRVKMVPVRQVPPWLEEIDPDIAQQYSRVAVALGGARPFSVRLRESSITAGDVKATSMMDGYYQQGS